MFTVMYLQGDTYNQMQTHLKNFLKNSHFKQKDIINKIFNKFSKVRNMLKQCLKTLMLNILLKES